MAVVSDTESTHQTTDRVSQAAHEAIDRAAERGGRTEERVREAGRRAADRTRDGLDIIPQYIEHHPYRSLGIAAAA
ncbi:MAG TPA: hypothetical protein VKA48_08245, partial [Gammaproteobacteria bacterium]|nr:hypothetical protein [Gammaproteobacteria bacterium]